MTILIDADVFIAIHHPKDALHNRVTRILTTLVEKYNDQDIEWFTSWDAVDETTTKLSYVFGKKVALDFLRYLARHQITIIYPNADLALSAQKIFTSITSKNVSLTDCMNMTIWRDHQFDYLFSFDRVYRQQKIRLLTELIS